jgi:hypothetical protein
VLEAVPLASLEMEFLQMVALLMNEQNKIICAFASMNGFVDNPNVYWSGDMVQTTISHISTSGFGDHDDLSILLCDDSCSDSHPSSKLKTQGEDVQTVTLVPSDVDESKAPVSVIWSTMINDRKVELARVQTGPFDFHIQGHLMQKLSQHAVKVDIVAITQSGAEKST